MKCLNIIASPLEQFEILPLISLNFGLLDFSITNQTIILALISFIFVTYFLSFLKQSDNSLFIIPSRWQVIVEFVYSLVLNVVAENIGGKKSEKFFPLVFTIFTFILSMNLIGLVPYSFTVTSHAIVTFSLSIFIFIGINIICVRAHGLEFFSLFVPSGTSVPLSFVIVPIEVFSYAFKPLSLGVRLFCNMMVGHTLLKVFAGFAWSLMACSGVLFLAHYIPLLVIIPLFGLELGVATIQAFVFSLLVCIQLNDAINLH
jgi:F0F1-type ATP synthase membrane subunit a